MIQPCSKLKKKKLLSLFHFYSLSFHQGLMLFFTFIYKDILFIRKMGFLVPKAPKGVQGCQHPDMLSNVKILWCFPFSFHFFFSFEILMNKFDGREQWHCQLLESVYLSLSSLVWFDVSLSWEALIWKELYAKFMNRTNISFGSSPT